MHTMYMLENNCTRTAQSSCGGCSRRVHKIEYLAVNKINILVNFFTSENIHRELLSVINPAVYLFKVSKGAKVRNQYNQVPHLTQDTNVK